MGVDYSEVVGLAAHLHSVPGRIVPLAKAITRKSGFDTVADAQVASPVDTGTLASSISVDYDADGLGWVAGPTVEYGAYVEYGTSGPYIIPGAFGRDGYVEHPGISPQPYMGPAFDDQVDTVDTAIGQAGYQVLA